MEKIYTRQYSNVLDRDVWARKDCLQLLQESVKGYLTIPSHLNLSLSLSSIKGISSSSTSSASTATTPLYSSSESDYDGGDSPSNKEQESFKISTLVALASSRKYSQYYDRLISIIKSQFYLAPSGANDFIQFLNSSDVKSGKMTDTEICEKLRQIYISLPSFVMDKVIDKDTNRGKSIAKNLYKQLELFQSKEIREESESETIQTINLGKPNSLEIKDYLDFACYDGNITHELGKLLKLSKNHVFGVDIQDYPERNKNITFKQIKQLKTGETPEKLPFKDRSIDLITCSMVLHHIPNIHLEFLISEFHRILRNNGLILIKEHNIDTNREKYLRYVVDVQHLIFDLVWKEKSSTWEQESYINYLPERKWTHMFKNNGFSVALAAPYNINRHKNPFNKFISIYRKPIEAGEDEKSIQTPILTPQKTYHTFFRKLTFDMPRKVYRRRLTEVKNVLHWGQRKLFLTELEFLTIYFKKNPIIRNDTNVVVVYAGAAPGTHITLLSRMFDTVTFELYDPRPFNPVLDKYSRIHTHQEYFTDEISKQWSTENNPGKIILLVSDIRTANPMKMDNQEVEDRVKADQEMQSRWYRIMNPALTMFKFRLPWDNSITKYLKGDIYIQPYPPSTSTETRLIVDGPGVPDIEYDNKTYEEILFNFNTEQREWDYDNILKDIPVAEKCGLTDKYDSVAEIEIISEYLRLKGKNVNLRRICIISENISKYIPGRTLRDVQPLKYHHKIHLKILKSKNIIPNDVPYTKETYDTYVVPYIDKYLKEGIL